MLRTAYRLLLLLLLLKCSPIMAASPSASRSFIVIVAATAGSLGIGKNGKLPWRLAADMAYFKRCTSTPTTTTQSSKVNAVIMGRKTWQSIPGRFRPLQGRRNVVLSRNPKAREDLLLPEDVLVAGSLSEALTLLALPPHSTEVDKVFVIGGGSVYAEAVASELCEKVLLTSVRAGDGRFEDCDVHFPALHPEAFKLAKKGEDQEEKGVRFSFDEYDSVLHSVAAASAAAAAPGAGAAGAGAAATAAASTGSGNPSSADSNKENDASGSINREGSTTTTTTSPTTVAGDDSVGSKRKSCGSDDDVETQAQKAAPPQPTAPTAPASTTPAAAAAAAGEQEEGEGNEEEMQYLRLVEDILDNGVRRGDRTGTGTLSKFGVQMRFSLRQDRFPLLTTKRVFWRGVAEELLWFVSGCTNANVLKDRGIHIWDGNGSREFLDG